MKSESGGRIMDGSNPLTPVESDALQACCKSSKREAASATSVGESTLQNYCSRACRKLDAENIEQVVCIAIRRGFIAGPALNPGIFRKLTSQQVKLGELVGQGLTNAQIATQLYLSKEGAKSRLKVVYRVLGSNSRVYFAALVCRHLKEKASQ
jgi:DNA-binding NarL/FixJ family response regulator